jgi:c(7)-type cytochrome triheme protein
LVIPKPTCRTDCVDKIAVTNGFLEPELLTNENKLKSNFLRSFVMKMVSGKICAGAAFLFGCLFLIVNLLLAGASMGESVTKDRIVTFKGVESVDPVTFSHNFHFEALGGKTAKICTTCHNKDMFKMKSGKSEKPIMAKCATCHIDEGKAFSVTNPYTCVRCHVIEPAK